MVQQTDHHAIFELESEANWRQKHDEEETEYAEHDQRRRTCETAGDHRLVSDPEVQHDVQEEKG